MKIFSQICFVSLIMSYAFNPPASGQDVDTKFPSSVVVFPLRYAASAEVAGTIGNLWASQDSGIRIAFDERSNSLVVTADDPAKIDAFSKVLSRIDVPLQPEETEATMLELTAMFVIEGVDDIMNEILPAPPDQVRGIVTAMKANPYLPVFKNPRMGSIVMNRVMLANDPKTKRANAVGTVQGISSSQNGLCELQLSGKVSELGSGQYQLETEISLRLKPNVDQAYSSKIRTQVAITKEHPVILGLTSIEGVDCLVIVEIR